MRTPSEISVIRADPTRPHHKATMYVQGIPISTKNAFKSACAARGYNMRDVFIRLMRGFAEADLKNSGAYIKFGRGE